MPQHDHPPDTEGSILLANRNIVLEGVIETCQKENKCLRECIQNFVNILKELLPNIGNSGPTTLVNNLITEANKLPPPTPKYENPPNCRNLQDSGNPLNIGKETSTDSEIIPEEGGKAKNRSTTTYAEVTRSVPIKAQPTIRRVIAKQNNSTNKMKRTIAYNNNFNKRRLTNNLNLTINVICYKDVENELVEQISDLTEGSATVRVNRQCKNVINIICTNDTDYKTIFNLLDDGVTNRTFKQECFPSPAIFTPKPLALSHSTSSKTIHYKLLESIVSDYIIEKGINVEGLYTNYSHKQFITRISFSDEKTCSEIASTFNLQHYKTIEQIRNETKETTSQCSFPINYSDSEITNGITRAFNRMNSKLDLNNLIISELTNHSGTTKYKLVKLIHTSMEEMNDFCKKNISLMDKQRNQNNFLFKPSIEILDSKIERKNKLHPYLPDITLNPATTKPEFKPTTKTVTKLDTESSTKINEPSTKIDTNNSIMNEMNSKISLLARAFTSLVGGLANNNIIYLDDNLKQILNTINMDNTNNHVMIDDDSISTTSSNYSTQIE